MATVASVNENTLCLCLPVWDNGIPHTKFRENLRLCVPGQKKLLFWGLGGSLKILILFEFPLLLTYAQVLQNNYVVCLSGY